MRRKLRGLSHWPSIHNISYQAIAIVELLWIYPWIWPLLRFPRVRDSASNHWTRRHGDGCCCASWQLWYSSRSVCISPYSFIFFFLPFSISILVFFPFLFSFLPFCLLWDGFLNPDFYISNVDIFIAVSQSGIRAHHGGLNFGILL